jgi:DNA-binding transcriptional regulator YiaG
MSVTKEQCRRVAQLMFPELWVANPVEAIAKAVEFLYEAAETSELTAPTNSQHAQSSVVRTLADHIHRHKLHINVVARAIGVSQYTVRTWLEGKYSPNENNTAKISAFIENLQATPELLKPEA